MTYQVQHVSVAIKRSASEVYAFLADARNFPKWAPGFCLSIVPTQEKDVWEIDTTVGKGRVRFVEQNQHMVLDHYVHIDPATDAYMPMRVLANKEGAEVMLSVFRTPGFSDEEYAKDIAAVQGDLQSLKTMIEKG